jgi:selenide, water dikinase
VNLFFGKWKKLIFEIHYYLILGGLLICLPRDKAEQFVAEIQELDNCPAWIIGSVVENTSGQPNQAFIAENFSVVEV